MNDLISRQAAIDEIKEPMMLEYVWSYSCKEEEEAISVLVETIYQQTKSIIADRLERLKSADVVEVVRCKDCKHQEKYFYKDRRRKDGGYYIYGCELAEEYSHICLDDDFCSRAERRTDERLHQQTGGN